jgi:anti-anti-sigma factor
MSVADDSSRIARPFRGHAVEAPRVELCELSDHTTVVTLGGEHDLFTKYRVCEALAKTNNAPNVIIDLTACVFVDSSIVSVLLGVCRSTSPEQRIEIVLPDNGNEVNRALDIMGVRDLLHIHHSLGDALQRAGEHHAATSIHGTAFADV